MAGRGGNSEIVGWKNHRAELGHEPMRQDLTCHVDPARYASLFFRFVCGNCVCFGRRVSGPGYHV